MKNLSCLILLVLSGCVAVDPAPSWRRVHELSEERIDADTVWIRSDDEAQLVEQTVEAMLKDGLTRDESLRIAVLKNLRLQARFNDLGVATAAVVEASLPTNPTLDGWLGLPGRSGASSLGLVAWLSDLWIIPQRSAVAELMAQRTEYVVTIDIMNTAIRGASSWDRLVAAQQALGMTQELLQVRRDHAQRVAIRFAHGLDDSATLDEAKAMVAEEQVALQKAKQDLTQARTNMSAILATPEVWRHVPSNASLSPTPSPKMQVSDSIEFGMSNRLDLLAGRVEVEQATRAVGLEDALIWRSVSLGTNKEGQFSRVYDSNVEADESFGPTISIEIPIFNQNQAGRAAASFELQRAIKLLDAARVRATKEIVDSFQRYENSNESLRNLEEIARPAIVSRLKYMEEWNLKMQVPFLEVLAAREKLIAVDMEINMVREERNNSWRELEFATKGGEKR